MLDIFSIGKIVFIVAAIVWIIRDYKAKNFIDIPRHLVIIYFFSVSIIYAKNHSKNKVYLTHESGLIYL